MGKMFQNASSLKPHGQLKPNCPGIIIGRSSTECLFYMPIGNPRWPPPNIFPIGSNVKLSSAIAAILNFISEQKTYSLKFKMAAKMAAMAELSLTLDPMGKMFQNASSLKPLGQLKPNSPGMIIGRSSTNFMFFMSII
jgi:hypothetical protein